MALQDFIRVVVILAVLQINHGQLIKPDALVESGEMCKKLARDPYFDNEAIIGKPWRVYYTWKIKMDTRCLDMVFKNTTSWITDRFWGDMNEYLEQQPYWGAATLHMTMGSAERELLLFSDQGAAGSFDAVPNVIRDGNMAPRRGTVPLLKFQMKLIKNNKYLLISDCHIGIMSLSARVGQPPYKMEIASIAADLNFGEGYPSCINEKRKDEQFYVN